MDPHPQHSRNILPAPSRRALLKAAAGAIALPMAGLSWRPASAAALKPLKLAWNTGAVCGAPVAVAKQHGLFEKHGLDVEFINYAGTTEQLLEAIATGKADVGHGMALRWLKPLEQGFDVRIVAGVHGGCMRLLGAKAGGVTGLTTLKGKIIAVADQSSPARHFFSILLAREGVDPVKDVEWRVYPGDLLAAAVEKGEAQAVAHWDPVTFKFLKTGNFVEIASNLSGEYRNRVCCVLGVRGSLLRDDKAAAAALVRAVFEAQDFTAHNPVEAAKAYQPYAPKTSVEDLAAQLASHTHHHHPVGADVKREIALYAQELKDIQVFKPSTDPAKFADRVYADVLA
jgi:NitT/TauT family transport system substrate-binding protein